MMDEYTIKQIAELLDTSKTTIQNIVKKYGIEFTREDKRGCRFYSYEDTVRIIRYKEPLFDFSVIGKPQNSPQTDRQIGDEPQKLSQNSPQITDKPPTEKESLELQLLRHTIEIIEKELVEKDKQLSIKDKQIQDVNRRLEEAYELIKGQQIIAVADKRQELTLEENNNKPSFWKRLFRRK